MDQLEVVRQELREHKIDVDVILEAEFEPRCFAAGTLIDLADGTQKPIEQIEVGDRVLAFDSRESAGRGQLTPRQVTQLFATPERLVIDFHGLKVTPGHVFLCGDRPHAGEFRMLLDILVDDGAIVDKDGRVIRAATNCAVGSREDGFVETAYITELDRQDWRRTRLRAGTRLCLPDGDSVSLLDRLQQEGYELLPDGLVAQDGEAPHPLFWFGLPPKPEDYVLARSGVTLDELYEVAGERPTPVWPSSAGPGSLPAGTEGGPDPGLLLRKRAGETLQ